MKIIEELKKKVFNFCAENITIFECNVNVNCKWFLLNLYEILNDNKTNPSDYTDLQRFPKELLSMQPRANIEKEITMCVRIFSKSYKKIPKKSQGNRNS